MLAELWARNGQPLRARQPHVPHGLVFNGLDQIDQAISDLAATSAVLDEIIANMSDGDTKHEAIDNLFRHLQADLATLQRANSEARAAIPRPAKGGALGYPAARS